MSSHEIIVQKYGGTSISNSDRMRKAARRIKRRIEQGQRLVVVVSAQGDTTDRLIGLGLELNEKPPTREMDMLMTTGEQVSIALMTMALMGQGVKAVSQTGWQVGIRTNGVFGGSAVLGVNGPRILDLLKEYECIVVAGFQGISDAGEITTLGRGGSDTTALALAAAINARECEIFTDVDGVFTADPRHVDGTRLLVDLSYDEMLEMASEGARVMDGRAVSFAKGYGIAIRVRSCFNDDPGTVIRKEIHVEKRIVRAVSCKKNLSKVTLAGVPKTPGSLHRIFARIADAGINIDAIIQTDTTRETTDVSFTLLRSDLPGVVKILQDAARELSVTDVQYEVDCAKVSIIGEGMKSRPGIAARLLEALSEREISVYMISTSDVSIAVIIDLEAVDHAVQAVHDHFHLGEAEGE